MDRKKCNSNQIWNNDKCRCECKNPRKIVCDKGHIWDSATSSCENGRYARDIIDDSVITCNKILEPTKSIPTNFNEKKVICKTKNFYILLVFLLIPMTLLIAVSIYFFIKYR